MTETTDTHRRAALRGREAVARWRIQSGVWAGRLFALLFAVLSILPLLRQQGPDWGSAIVLALLAAGIVLAAERMRRSSRLAACLLLVLFVNAKLSDWLLAGVPWWHGALLTVIIAGALTNGVWGTFALVAVQRDAAQVPPAPPRTGSRTPAV
jgi:hypothetical protein